MSELPSAYIHRIDGKTPPPPRQSPMPGATLLRFVIGIWPATMTALAAAGILVTMTL